MSGSRTSGGDGRGGKGGDSDRKRPRPHHSRASHRRQKSARTGGAGGGAGAGARRGVRGAGVVVVDPRKGAPGVLLTCEAGREGKCRSEGLDILMHYYLRAVGRGGGGNDGGGGGGAVSNGRDGRTTTGEGGGRADGVKVGNADEGRGRGRDDTKKGRELSLREEIALLRGGATADDVLEKSSSFLGNDDDAGDASKTKDSSRIVPFASCDTGCKGTALLLCTLPDCNLVHVAKPHRPLKCNVAENGLVGHDCEKGKKEKGCSEEEREGGRGTQGGGNGNVGTDTNSRKGGEASIEKKKNEPCDIAGKEEKEKIDDNEVDHDHDHDGKKKNERKANDNEVAEVAAVASSSPPWDPIRTVRTVVDDLVRLYAPSAAETAASTSDANADAAPPNHDFDATPALTRTRYHDPAPESRFITRMIPIQVTCFASVNDIVTVSRPLIRRYMMDEIVSMHNDVRNKGKKSGHHETNSKRATFEIAFKRRNCAHLRREHVIEAVAKVVGELREEVVAKAPASASASSGGKDAKDRKGAMPDISVDLTNPDYTIQIEVCKTICGVAVISNSKSFRKFNLFDIRQEKNTEKDNKD